MIFEFPGSIGHGPRASAHWVGDGGGKIGGEVLFHLPPMRVGVSVSVVFSWRASASSMQDDRYHDMLRSIDGHIAQDKNEFWVGSWNSGRYLAGSDPAGAVFSLLFLTCVRIRMIVCIDFAHSSGAVNVLRGSSG